MELLIFMVLQILWTLLPQTGYIHPDEFFQTTEVIAGDVFGVETVRPWEFNKTFPIRSIVLPMAVCSPVFNLLQYLQKQGYFPSDLASPPAYWLLVSPRLVMSLLNILIAMTVIKIAKNLGYRGRPTLLFYITSYISLVYFTRTFTNTFEAFLFAALLYFCTRRPKYDKSGKPLFSDGTTLAISFVTTAGFFNRPTFLVFGFVPIMYWLFVKSNKLLTFMRKITYFCFAIALYAFIFVLADTAYYAGSDPIALLHDLRNVQNWSEIPKMLIFTPVNFLLYNLNSKNLAEHGLHPRFTHFLVNIPMLFGPCALIIFSALLKNTVGFMKFGRGRDLFLVSSIVVPVLGLSIFPHQEARFLIPLMAPVCVLCGRALCYKGFRGRLLSALWIIFNMVAAYVFGCLHQGGVVQALVKLQADAHETHTSDQHVIFFHTYMPPRHLLSLSVDKKKNPGNFFIHDLKGAPVKELVYFVENIQSRKQADLSIITPATVLPELCKSKKFEIQDSQVMWPHLSGEDLPDFEGIYKGVKHYGTSCIVSQNNSVWEDLGSSLSLIIVTLKTV